MCNARSGARGTQTWNNLSLGWLTCFNQIMQKNFEMIKKKLWTDLGAILQRCLLHWGPFKVGGETEREHRLFNDLVFSRLSAKWQSDFNLNYFSVSIDVWSNSFVAGSLRCPEHLLHWLLQRWPTITHSSSPSYSSSISTSWFFALLHHHVQPRCY